MVFKKAFQRIKQAVIHVGSIHYKEKILGYQIVMVDFCKPLLNTAFAVFKAQVKDLALHSTSARCRPR